TWLQEELTKTRLKRKLFGKAPWHRKESRETLSSVTSSVRDVLRGSTPPSSPITDLSPPSALLHIFNHYAEAVRVKTPPLNSYVAHSKSRSYLTSMTPPNFDGSKHSSDASLARSTSRLIGHRRGSVALE
ncbi:hypothetical protein BGZ63DRAFT_442527, partial [Mariannaea sp. PMI_226]